MARRYWYLFHHCECPVCGADHSYKERVYKRPVEAHRYEIYYDWCDAL